MSTTAQAQKLLREGRAAEAERAYEHILEHSPDDAEALNVVALAALRRRDFHRAVQLLEHAVSAHPEDFHSRYHLARALHDSGDLVGALTGYEAALRMRPHFYAARLHYASLLDRNGEQPRALGEYVRALDMAQREGRWLDPATTPTHLQPLIERAVQFIMQTKRSIAAQTLDSLTRKFGSAELGRVTRAVRIYLREEEIQLPDPRQQPSFFYFPDLPPSPYLDCSLLPWIDALEARTDEIRAELLQRLPGSAGRERVFLSEDVERANLRGMDNPRGTGAEPSWNGYYFYRHGQRRADNCAACPATASALDALPLAHVADNGPEVLFSVFTPGTHLLPHRGVTNTRLVGHLPLIIPPDCALRVGGQLHVWQAGRVVVFDDTYEHEAWNRSDDIRVVLIFDIWNPYLTEIERQAIAELVPQLGALRPPDA